MEFYVVDPKDQAFDGWVDNVRGFFEKSDSSYSEENGELYYIGDDVATPWREKSVLFTMPGDEGGIVEIRRHRRQFLRLLR